MTRPWPEAEDLLTLLGEWTGPQTRIRDAGILFAVASRPHAQMLGRRVYPTAIDQAAALLHAIAVWRPLEVWNAGLAWAAGRVLLRRAGFRLVMPAKEQMALIDAVTNGELDSVDEIAVRLAPYLSVRE